MTPLDSPRITYIARDLAMGHASHLSLLSWRAQPTVASADVMRQRYLALARQNPGGFFSFGVIEAGVPNPDEPARKAISAAMDAVEKELLGAAVVLEATGFGAAALRAMLATMSMLTRSRFPRKFFASVDEAAAWTARLRPELGGAAAIAASFAAFRAQL